MKRALLLPLVLVAGLGAGAGSGFAVGKLRHPPADEAKPKPEPKHAEGEEEKALSFVATGPILAPMVTADGHLNGYARFEAQLQVPAEQAEEVSQHLPLLLHAMNMRTYRAPLASGPDGELPDLELFRRLLTESCATAFGKDVVKQVAITNIAAG